MVQAVLAGADGHSPAIDQTTGTPLTMEMLLRRRGMITTDGGGSLMQQQPAQGLGGSPVAASTNAVPPSIASAGTGAASMPPGVGAAPSSIPADPTQAVTQSADPSAGVVASTGSSGSGGGLDYLLPLLLSLASKKGADKIGAARSGTTANKNGTGLARNGAGPDAFGAGDIGTASGRALQARKVQDGSFRVIGDDPALPAPQNKVGGSKVAGALSARRNPSANVPAVMEPGQIPTGPMADGQDIGGVLRTLGIDPAMVQTLEHNPGLMETLRRVRPH